MADNITIGSHVHLRGYYKGHGNGVVTDIRKELNGDRFEYIAAYVEYDTPLDGPWPYQSRKIRRGKHAIERLELL